MIENNGTWYLGAVANGQNYKLAKYTDTSMSGYVRNTDAKVGLLRVGELMSGQFESYRNNTEYWALTPYMTNVNTISNIGSANYKGVSTLLGIKPSLNLKSNVIITSGDGTKENPFEIELAS